MPKLPEGATPSRTCPDRYDCSVMRNKNEPVNDRDECPYLAAYADERLGVRLECLDRKRFVGALKL